MSDLISLEEAIEEVREAYEYEEMLDGYEYRLNELPSVEIIHCRECKNHIDERCIVANHHTADHECCAEVFGAERKDYNAADR